MKNLTELFCSIDDFWKRFELLWKKYQISSSHPRGPTSSLSMSEIITILILFHQSNFRTFKHFYFFLLGYHKKDFPGLPSYSRFVWIKKAASVPLLAYLICHRGKITGISFIDSTALKVCNIKRSHSHKVFKDIARKGKSTIGWFFGFKLHLVVNEHGEILSFHLTPGNVSDKKPVTSLVKGIWGKIFGDKGYISKELFEELLKQNLKLITAVRKNMKNKFIYVKEKILLRKRAIIESIYDLLKNIFQIEHSRHRSVANFFVNLLSGLAAYTFQEKKPSLRLDTGEVIAV